MFDVIHRKSVFLLAVLPIALPAMAQTYTPVQWTQFIPVAGQSEPVPAQWLQDEEARIAHNLKLPDSVPKPVPYTFAQPLWEKLWFNAHKKASVRYFNHLCSTEAGQWVFKTVPNVEGLYFARPQSEPTTDVMTDPYGPEMPWIQRIFMLSGNGLHDQGATFISPPAFNYRYVEQPRRAVEWQAHIQEPYVRLFGYTTGFFVKPGQVVVALNERTPMQITGIPTVTARYGYTWRGLKRAQDREHGIAGGEIIIYDLQTKEVLAVRRQFLIASHNPRGAGKAMWEVAAACSQLRTQHPYSEARQFAFDILQTIEPSHAH